MDRAEAARGRAAPPATGAGIGVIAAYAAGILAFGYALVSVYWRWAARAC